VHTNRITGVSLHSHWFKNKNMQCSSSLAKYNLRYILLELVQWYWKRSKKCKSSQTGRRTEREGKTMDGPWETRRAYLSFQLRRANNAREAKRIVGTRIEKLRLCQD
jgi:hypothetical protein